MDLVDSYIIDGTCEICNRKITSKRPGVSIGSSYTTVHTGCLDKAFKEIEKSAEKAEEQATRWLEEIKDGRERIQSKQGTQIKGYTWLAKQLVKTSVWKDNTDGIFETLFPNGLRSEKTVVTEINVRGRLDDLNHPLSRDGQKLIVSSRGIGTQEPGTQKDKAADYLNDPDLAPQLLLIMMAHKDELVDSLSSHKDRNKKMATFIDAIREVLHPEKLYSARNSYYRHNYEIARKTFDDVGNMGPSHMGPSLEIDDYNCHAMSVDRKNGRLVFRGVYEVSDQFTDGTEERKTNNMNWADKFKRRDYYSKVIPVAEELLEKAEEHIEEREELMQKKLDFVEEQVKDYLLAYAL